MRTTEAGIASGAVPKKDAERQLRRWKRVADPPQIASPEEIQAFARAVGVAVE